MSRLTARCRIGCQIAVLGLIGIIGTLTITGIDHWGGSQIDHANGAMEAARHARDLNTGVQVALLQARQHEKNFLLRHDEQSLADHSAAIQIVQRSLDDLRAQVAGQPELLADVDRMADDTQRYATTFETVAANARRIGLREDQGLLGALRASVHDVEDKLRSFESADARIAMLLMRRNEKDFIARLDPRYAAEVKALLPSFAAAIAAGNAPSALQQDVMARMDSYQKDFARFAAGTLEQVKAVDALAAIHHGIEPRLVAADTRFVTAAEDAARQAHEITNETHHSLLVALAATIAVVLCLSWIVGRGIARPIVTVTRAMQRLVNGDLATPIPTDQRRDEIGTMISVVGVLKDSLLAAEVARAKQATMREQAEMSKRTAMRDMADRIESEANSAVSQIGERTATMTHIVGQMRALAERTGGAAEGAVHAATLALGNAQTVAGAAEQLSASIQKVSGQVNQSTAVVGQAVAAGVDTRATIEALNERVGRIGAVADIIGDIAAKTNLLALNATIEAVRAGEAGKGFAVVASEVKQLANQTAQSTKEIARHVGEVRAATTDAVAAVHRIETTINEVHAIAGSIAAAVEEQGAATAEIARNVTGTAAAVNEMNGRNAEVSQAASETGRQADDVLGYTSGLNGAIDELRQVIVRTVRTSTVDTDRRLLKRYAIDLPCQLSVAGKPPMAGRIADISENGARLIGSGSLAVNALGTLSVEAIAAPVAFVVHGSDADSIRILFTADEADRSAINALIERASLSHAA